MFDTLSLSINTAMAFSSSTFLGSRKVFMEHWAQVRKVASFLGATFWWQQNHAKMMGDMIGKPGDDLLDAT